MPNLEISIFLKLCPLYRLLKNCDGFLCVSAQRMELGIGLRKRAAA